ncbi:hypothetical protein RU639_008131 [Aspergillus parasiticus]
MRLLHTEERHTGNFEIIEFTDDRIPPYAILSHTWEGGEVTFQDMHADKLHTRQKKGYSKIQRCCHLAKTEGFEYVWIDSCCIDKTSSAELSEAINSMYRWYQEAEVCYAYLADVPSKGFKESRWFTRGWTLQELIAPTKITFLDANWKGLGSKADLQQAISECTRILIGVLSGDEDIESFSIAQRMSWAAERVTTRVEDRAYSLLGIFGVNIPLIYGERETAFIRLQEEIMRISDDHSLFAWRSPDNRGGLLATSPAGFIDSHNIVRFNPFDAFNAPFAATSTGIDLKVRFMGIGPRGLGLAILHCKEEEGDRLIALYVRDSEFLTMERFERVHSEGFKQLDIRKYRPSQYPMRQMIIQAGRLTRHRKSKDCGNCDSITPEIYTDAKLMTLMAFEEPFALLQAAEEGLEDIVWLLLTRSDVEGGRRGPGGVTPLIRASQKGHETIARMLVARRDVIADSTDDEGRTPLWWAAEAGHEAIVKMLVEKSTSIEVKDSLGRTPLTIASKNGHEGTVGMLLDKGAALEVQDHMGHTPLLLAAWRDYENIVKMLLKRGANIETQNSEGNTPLLLAVWKGYENTVKVLLEKGANIEAQDSEGNTPLLLAAQKGYENTVKMLLEGGANIETQDPEGHTPLLLAAWKGYENTVKVLLEGGANIEAQDKVGRTPLLLAAWEGYKNTVKVLLERGAAIEIQNKTGCTLLLVAAWKRYKNIVKVLIEEGAVVEVRDREGWTPLLGAAFGGYVVVGRVLLENGADIEAHHPNGLNSLLYCSAWHARNTFAKMLLENGANIEARDARSQTALFLAVWEGHIDIVKLLLQHGAEANIRNCDGHTPMDIAKSKGQKAIVKLLREWLGSYTYLNALSIAVGRFLAPKPPNRGFIVHQSQC